MTLRKRSLKSAGGTIAAQHLAKMGYTARTERRHEVEIMHDKSGAAEKISDAELIALVRKVQQKPDTHGELNEVNLLLRDFANELLKQRLFLGVKFAQIINLSAAR